MSDDTIPITRPSSTNTAAREQSIIDYPNKAETTRYPSDTIDLPSRGHFYAADNPLSVGSVEVKPITAKEEDILTNANYIKSGVVLDKLLESVLIDKKIKTTDFLIGDKNAVFVALRRLAYGDSYGPLKIKCNSCKKDSDEVLIDLGKVKFKELDFSKWQKNVNLFEFELPFCKRKVTFKLMSSKDELLIESELKVSQKLKLPNNEFTTRLRNIILSVDGNEDKAYIKKFVEEELPSKDSLVFRKYINDITPNIDLSFDFVCSNCENEERIGVPMTAQFFWPDTGA